MEFDIVCCAPSLFVGLAQEYGCAIGRTEEYINNRQDIHDRWREITGLVDGGVFKQAVFSFLNGGRLHQLQFSETGLRIGDAGVRRLLKDSFLVALEQEMHAGMGAIVSHALSVAQANGGSYQNFVGATLQVKPGFKDCQRLGASVLTGLEQFVIRAMCSEVQELKAIIFDGFVAPAQDVGRLEHRAEEAVRKELGLDLHLKLKLTTL